MLSSDRSTLRAFGAFWIVIIVGVLTGYAVANAVRVSTSSTVAARPAKTRVAVPRHSAVGLPIATWLSARAPVLKGYGKRRLTTLIATGDVIPARSVNYRMTIYNDFLYPFRRTAGYLRSGDITLINLESPLLNGCPVTVQGLQFCGNPRAVDGMRFAGVDVACTANNHIGNYGPEGIQETWQHLRAAGIQVCGLGDVAFRTVRGIRFAFLAYNAVGQRFDYATSRKEIRAARKKADVVVVSMHWGKEYVAVPSIAPGIADDNPRKVAHWIIDSGADLIIGNHPHHVQGLEAYRGKLIVYAHGNFAFDQMFTIPDCPGDYNQFCSTREGVVGAYTFLGKHLVGVHYRPVVIYDYAQPRWAGTRVADEVLAEMLRSSKAIARARRV